MWHFVLRVGIKAMDRKDHGSLNVLRINSDFLRSDSFDLRTWGPYQMAWLASNISVPRPKVLDKM